MFSQFTGGTGVKTMQLTLRDVVTLFNESEKTIHQWIQEEHLPAYRVNDRYRFNRVEILEWAAARKKSIVTSPSERGKDRSGATNLAAGLEAGGVIRRLPGADRSSVFRAMIDRMPLPDAVDRALLLQMLLAREAVASTGIGDGIAIPHTRHPIVQHVDIPMVFLCFLGQPIDFQARDGQPVHTLFTLITPTVRLHLVLIARIVFALHDPAFKETILRRAPDEEILFESRRIDSLQHADPPMTGAERNG